MIGGSRPENSLWPPAQSHFPLRQRGVCVRMQRRKELKPGRGHDYRARPIMNLDEGQRKKVAEWIGQGLKLSEIQTRLVSELGVKMTYMDVRFLVDDLKLVPKDIEPVKPVSGTLSGAVNVETKAGGQT